MPTHKPDRTRVSITDIEDLTGFAYRTIVKRLGALNFVDQDGKTLIYSSRDALPLVYGYPGPQAERSKFDRARAEKTELEVALMRSCPGSRSRWRSLPSRSSMRFIELSGDGAPARRRRTRGGR